MRTKALPIIILLLLIILLTATNPDKEDFISWASNQIQEKSNNEIEEFLGGLLAKPVMTITTKKNDFFILSIFTIELPDKESVFIGVLKSFIKIK